VSTLPHQGLIFESPENQRLVQDARKRM